MQIAHRQFHGKEPRFLHFPLGPVRTLLAAIEPALRPVLPVTAGQLAVFVNDSTASPNWLYDKLKGRMSKVETIIAGLIERSHSAGAELVNTTPIAQPDLSRECDIFCCYLVGQKPTAYIRNTYLSALNARRLLRDAEFSAFDRTTLRLARHHTLLVHLADTYCALFHRHGALRSRLVLLLAILEHTAPTNAQFDKAKSRGLAGVIANLFISAVGFTLALLIATLLLLPFQLISKLKGRQA